MIVPPDNRRIAELTRQLHRVNDTIRRVEQEGQRLSRIRADSQRKKQWLMRQIHQQLSLPFSNN